MLTKEVCKSWAFSCKGRLYKPIFMRKFRDLRVEALLRPLKLTSTQFARMAILTGKQANIGGAKRQSFLSGLQGP